MRCIRNLVLIGVLLGLMAFVSSVAGEVDWSDGISDPGGDVIDGSHNVVDFPSVDIRSVSIIEDGDDINVTMVLEAAYNESGTYSVAIGVDDTENYYGLVRTTDLGFSMSDPAGGSTEVTGYYSADGKMVSWVVAKENITVTEGLRIEHASAIVVDMMTGSVLQDFAGMDYIPSEMPNPDSMVITMSMPKLNVLQMKVTVTFEGEDANTYRVLMDSDQDGTISQEEFDKFLEDLQDDEEPDPAEANVTLDGKDPTDLDSEYILEGAKGATDSGADFKMIVTMKVTFPKVEDKDTHEVVFEEPFGEDFIGGDEPWENEFDMTLKFQAPDGWVFKGGSLPSKMKDYLNDDGDEVSMNAADIEKDWNSTFANLQVFTIEKADEEPGFGLVLAVTAATVAAFAVRRRR
jgi:hypothetical protein